MAGPVTHIVLAAVVLNGPLADKDKQTFIIGTSFPDIRYLGCIKREQTHNAQPSWQEIIFEQSAFKAGMDFHALIDLLREKYFVAHGMYELVPESSYRAYALKFYEDLLLYDEIDNWLEISTYFNTLLSEEGSFNIPAHYIMLWHSLIKLYVSELHNTEKIRKVLSKFGFTGTAIKEVSHLLGKMRQDPRIKELIFQFYHELPNLLEQSLHYPS